MLIVKANFSKPLDLSFQQIISRFLYKELPLPVMHQSIPSLSIPLPRATPGDSHILIAPGVGFSLPCLARGSAPGGS